MRPRSFTHAAQKICLASLDDAASSTMRNPTSLNVFATFKKHDVSSKLIYSNKEQIDEIESTVASHGRMGSSQNVRRVVRQELELASTPELYAIEFAQVELVHTNVVRVLKPPRAGIVTFARPRPFTAPRDANVILSALQDCDLNKSIVLICYISEYFCLKICSLHGMMFCCLVLCCVLFNVRFCLQDTAPGESTTGPCSNASSMPIQVPLETPPAADGCPESYSGIVS